jgi:hypothetical protein
MLLPTLVALTVVLLGLAVVCLGALLVRRGLRARLLDRDPRCRGCRYLLVNLHILPAKCPECGLRLPPANAVEGARAPRWSVVLAGVALAIVGLAPFGAALVPRVAPVAVAPPARAAAPAAAPARPFCKACARWHPAGPCSDYPIVVRRSPVATAPMTVMAAEAPRLRLPVEAAPEGLRPVFEIDVDDPRDAPPAPARERRDAPDHGVALSWLDLQQRARPEPFVATWASSAARPPALSWTSGGAWSAHDLLGGRASFAPRGGGKGALIFDPAATGSSFRGRSPAGHRNAGFAERSPASPHRGPRR